MLEFVIFSMKNDTILKGGINLSFSRREGKRGSWESSSTSLSAQFITGALLLPRIFETVWELGQWLLFLARDYPSSIESLFVAQFFASKYWYILTKINAGRIIFLWHFTWYSNKVFKIYLFICNSFFSSTFLLLEQIFIINLLF